MMEAQEARLLGIAHCIIRQPELQQNSQIFLTPPIPLLPLLKAQIPIIPNNIMHTSPSIVQLIMPAPIILQPVPIEQTTVTVTTPPPPTTTTTTTTTSTTISTPVTTDAPATTTLPPINTIATSTQPSTTEIETLPTIDLRPIIGVTPASVTTVLLTTLETDNSVDENFSPIPQVMGPSPDRAQQLLEPEEPPEILHDESLPTK